MAIEFDLEVRPVNMAQLREELNNSSSFTSTCTALSDNGNDMGNNITTFWSIDLTVEEEAAQLVAVANHIPEANTIEINDLPISDLGDKLWVHSSSKPVKGDKSFYLGWTGAGDDITDTVNGIGEGELLQYDITPGNVTVKRRIQFIPDHGDVFIHEGYVKFDNGGLGDYMEASVIASGSITQQVASLDLIVEDDWIKYSPSGAGTGTHGFAAVPVLIPRTFSKDGNWDYDEVNGLLPNMSNEGGYKISLIERVVHRYINKISTFGSSYGYNRLTSEETAYLPAGYCLEVTAYNNSDTTWHMDVMFEVFRERTHIP